MKKINGGKQMKDVWTLPAISKWEKSCGKHPTQKQSQLFAEDNINILDKPMPYGLELPF